MGMRDVNDGGRARGAFAPFRHAGGASVSTYSGCSHVRFWPKAALQQRILTTHCSPPRQEAAKSCRVRDHGAAEIRRPIGAASPWCWVCSRMVLTCSPPTRRMPLGPCVGDALVTRLLAYLAVSLLSVSPL